MAKLYLKLRNEDGSFREYRKDKIPARQIKAALQCQKKVGELGKKQDSLAILEERLKFTCDMFEDKELTPDAILDGLEVDELWPMLDEVFETVMGNKDAQAGKQ